MVLSYQTLMRIGPDVVSPFDPARVQPSSIDLTLDSRFQVPDRQYPAIHLDGTRVHGTTVPKQLGSGECFVLHPGEFVLGATAEVVTVPTDLVCRIEGKSSLGRLGLIVHATAGYVDPGFSGHLTLEMVNHFPVPIVLYPWKPICQISFQRLDAPCAKPYAGRYQGDDGPAGSRYGEPK